MGRRLAAEQRRIEIAGRMVMQVLRNVPGSASAEMLLDLIVMVIDDPAERALFRTFGARDPDPYADGAAVTVPRSPVLSGGAAAGLKN